MPTVLVTNQPPMADVSPLDGVADVLLGDAGMVPVSRERVLAMAGGLDAIINQGELRIDAELLDAAPRLRVVANVAIGVDNMDLPRMARRGVWGVNCPDAFTDATADATLGLLLCVARKLCEGDRFVRADEWHSFEPGRWDGMRLSGKTLGIVGWGKIGRAVARRAEAFGMRVIYYSRSSAAEPGYRPFDALLAEADVVSLHVPLTAETQRMFDAARLAKIKPGAILLNMARGRVVDESALVDALQFGRLGGAGLDVFENEPAVHPGLLTLPNVAVMPHVGGATREGRREARLLCAENVAAVLLGREPLTPVNRPEPHARKPQRG